MTSVVVSCRFVGRTRGGTSSSVPLARVLPRAEHNPALGGSAIGKPQPVEPDELPAPAPIACEDPCLYSPSDAACIAQDGQCVRCGDRGRGAVAQTLELEARKGARTNC